MEYFDFVQQYCESKPLVTAGFPFDETTIVWKVEGKIFCIGDIKHFESIALKCDPEKAQLLRQEHSQISGAYHMNKTHWNTIIFDGLSQSLLESLITHSFELVVRKLPKKTRELINNA
ncbi:MAG: MmcQ-like protein [Flavobacteriales bacterium]|nr:MmcQ/YjbR family DNA-binding protein [Flavobacteriaceae bacterium]PHX92062.1 MAG: MmcQ-like protein [Flavobacteriales bacterium]